MDIPRLDAFPEYLTTKELCKFLRIGMNRAYELARCPDFPKIPFGNRYVFPKALVMEWAEKQARKGMEPKKLKAI